MAREIMAALLSDPQVTAAPARAPMRRSTLWKLLLAPTVVILGLFFVVPVVMMAKESLWDPEFTLEHYKAFIDSPVYTQVLGRTLLTAFLVTVACLLIGYPFAYLMTIATGWRRTLLIGVILVPFWTSLLVRTVAWVFIMQDTGIINTALTGMGLTDEPIPLIRTIAGVTIAMTQVLLPFMVLPLFGTLSTIDSRMVQASYSLGAKQLETFWRIYLPLSAPGVVAGSLLVFVLSLGFYVTPAMLGGPQDIMLGQLIVQQISQVLNWGMGATAAMILLLFTLLIIAAAGLLMRKRLRSVKLS